MGLNTRSIFDPRFTQSMARTVNAGMTSRVLIRRPIKAYDKDAAEPVWNYTTHRYDGPSSFKVLATNVPARIMPNIDWRARGYEFGSETTVFQAVSVVIPLGFKYEVGLTTGEADIRDEDQIVITRNHFKGLDTMKKFVMIVRNPIVSSTDGWWDLLVDVNMKGGLSRGDS